MMLNRDNSLFSPEKSLSLPPQFDLDGQTLMETTKCKLPTIMDTTNNHDATQAPTTAGAGNTTTNILSPAAAALVDKTLNNNAQIAAIQNAAATVIDPQVSALLMSAFNPAFAMPHLITNNNNINNDMVLPKSVPTSELAGMSTGSAGGGGGATSLRKRVAAGAATGKKRNAAAADKSIGNNKKQRSDLNTIKVEAHNLTNGGGGTATAASSETGLDDDDDEGMMMMLMMEGATGSGGGDKQVARRERRMMSNRESARRSRKRKQEYLVNLEKEVQVLREMIAAKDTEMAALKIENEMLRGGGGQK